MPLPQGPPIPFHQPPESFVLHLKSQVACSRHLSQCQRCKAEGIACSYSRSGVIRRSRKQRYTNTLSTPHSETPVRTEPSGPPPPGQLASENDDKTTHERLRGLVGKDYPSLRTLGSLLEEYAAAWQGSSAFDKLAEGAEAHFFRFEDEQVRSWVDGEHFPILCPALLTLQPLAFAATLQKERLLLTSAPSEVLEHLAAAHPHQVHDRAWLVMFYSVALSVESSSNPSDQSTKAKLKSNLWLALNDIKLLLEPSPSSIQALVILACHVEEFMTPSHCWALITKACTMLQALGIAHGRLDSLTRERRTMLFWRLNLLDKALALMLRRPPAFHREMTAMIDLPTLDQILPAQPHLPSSGTPVLFNAHYMHQTLLLSRVMADVWHCLYGQNSDEVNAIKENLESWYRQASEVAGAPLKIHQQEADICSRSSRLLRLQRNLFSAPAVQPPLISACEPCSSITIPCSSYSWCLAGSCGRSAFIHRSKCLDYYQVLVTWYWISKNQIPAFYGSACTVRWPRLAFYGAIS